jgi:hypothetical protein
MSESESSTGVEDRAILDENEVLSVSEIATNFHLRRYERVEHAIEKYLHEHSWHDALRLIRQIPVKKTDIRHGWVWWKQEKKTGIQPVSQGKIRDGILSLLGLDMVKGIDVDLLKTFGRFKGGTLQEIREKVQSKAKRILDRQITTSNTFFLDTERMRGTTFGPLISKIISQRADEFTALGDKPSYSRAARTYYGFTYLTESLSQADTKALHDVCPGLLEFSGKRPSYQRSIYSHCSKQLTDLLLNHLRLTFARPQTQGKGADEIGLIADSRSLGVLHATLKKKTEGLLWRADPLNPVKYRIMWALGEIGHPSSVDHLRPFVGNHTFDSWAMWAISGISHTDALGILLDRSFNNPPSPRFCSRSTAVEYLWKLQVEEAIEPLIKLMQDRTVSDSALRSLMHLGSAGLSVIRDRMDLVGQVVKESHRTGDLMGNLLKSYPSLIQTDECITLLLEVVSGSPSLLSMVFEQNPEMIQDDRLRSPLLTVLTKSTDPAPLIYQLHTVGLLEDDDFKKIAEEKIPVVARLVVWDGRRGYVGHRTLRSIKSIPMLYESDEIQASLAEVIKKGKKQRALLSDIQKHTVLSHLHVIHDSVIDVLSSEGWDIWFLKEVVKSENLMRNEHVKVAVSKALTSFWSIAKNTRRCVFVDWDTSEYLWVYYLYPLRKYPEMGQLPEFQEAVANLLRNTKYPDGVLRTIRDFDGLLESDPVKKETGRIAAEKEAEKEREKRYWSSMKPLSEHEIAKEIRKAREAHWDHYDEQNW